MTVIAYDGRTVAADKLSTIYGLKQTCTKLQRHGRKVLATAGSAAHAMEMMLWFKSGADPSRCPTNRDEKTNAHLYVFERGKHVLCYEGAAIPHVLEDSWFAAGSGRDYAAAVLALGYTAEKAVQIASQLSTECGMGVDVIDLEELARGQDGGDGAGASPSLSGTVAALAG